VGGGASPNSRGQAEINHNTIVQKGSIRLTLKVGQTGFNISEQKKLARPIYKIGQASCKQKTQHTYKGGVFMPYPLTRQNPH
jgi:hypothetical protein